VIGEMVKLLDCTLRDGGYVNSFKFGMESIEAIKAKLCDANVDIIECGFLRSGADDGQCSLYCGVESIKLPERREDRMFVVMIESGGIPMCDVAKRLPQYVDGIRLTFHGSEWGQTKAVAQNLMEKGYKIFIQPVGTATYSDEALLALIREVNVLSPYSFYLVDTLGSMYKNDLLRLFYLIDHNLDNNVSLGFHSHNNLQLSFANAMTLLEARTCRDLIIDCSVFGMGRGAGNLNTELIAHYINQSMGKRYRTTPLLELMDEIILPIYKHKPWGFSEPYYLASIRGCHPSYASYLIDKKSISMTKIGELLDRLPPGAKHLFSKPLIEGIYIDDMQHNIDDLSTIEELRKKSGKRRVLVVAPGGSVKSRAFKIIDFVAKNQPYIIAVNFVPENLVPDLVFVGNQKRYLQLKRGAFDIAATSNINAENVYKVDYNSLLTDNSDSSGLMALQLLIRMGYKEACLAGYDGFTIGDNYYGKTYDNYLSGEAMDDLNRNISEKLQKIGKHLNLIFVTPSIYEEACFIKENGAKSDLFVKTSELCTHKC
jgi:4-hydroxy 2-oxovalerate aldolase